ncbi:RHS repeat-associated core domain-containing protein [Pseudomonas asiatica]|uniref:RHS repeat-associated core domain-containing protein n=1 Tax=Pseudomonas asiatica TaxID=2219225 RepID=UPI0037CB262D
MAAAKTKRRFYQNNHVCTELDGSVTRSIFRHQGSLLALCTSGADESRSIMAVNNSNTVMSELRDSGKAQFAYTPYGHRTVQGESNNPLAFNGEILDTPTDCYLLGSYRLFSTTFYGFCTPDDQSPFGKGGPNSKAYCAGDPVNNVDPTGHFPFAKFLNPAIFIGAGAVIGTAIAGSLVKDPKTQETLYITSAAISAAVATLIAGAYAHYRIKAFRLRHRVRYLESNNTELLRIASHGQTDNNILRNLIDSQPYPQHTAHLNPAQHARTFSSQPQTPPSVNVNGYYSSGTNEFSLPSSRHSAQYMDPPPPYSEAVGATSPNSAQQRHISANSHSSTMMELRQLT